MLGDAAAVASPMRSSRPCRGSPPPAPRCSPASTSCRTPSTCGAAPLHWLGGMGIIVLAVAMLPLLGVGGMQLYRAETPGPVKDTKLTPRITETAKALWLVYAGITAVCVLALWVAGMTPVRCHLPRLHGDVARADSPPTTPASAGFNSPADRSRADRLHAAGGAELRHAFHGAATRRSRRLSPRPGSALGIRLGGRQRRAADGGDRARQAVRQLRRVAAPCGLRHRVDRHHHRPRDRGLLALAGLRARCGSCS